MQCQIFQCSETLLTLDIVQFLDTRDISIHLINGDLYMKEQSYDRVQHETPIEIGDKNGLEPPSASPENVTNFQWLLSIKSILSLSTNGGLGLLAVGILLNILSGVIPVFYFIELANAIQEIANNYNDPQQYYEATQTISIFLVGAGGVYMIVNTISASFLFFFSRINGNSWRELYFKSLLEKDPGFYDLNPEAISGNNITMECRCIEEALGDELIIFIISASLFISLFITAMARCIELTLICLIVYLAQYSALKLSHGKRSESTMKAMEMYSLAGLKSEETLENIKTVASLNCQESKIAEYSECVRPLKYSYIKEGIRSGISWGLNYSVIFAVGGIMFYVATIYIVEKRPTWAQGEITITDFFFVFFCFFMGASTMGLMSTSSNKILKGIAISKKIQKLAVKKTKSCKNIQLGDESLKIKFKNVEFSYPSKPEILILRGLSFKMSPNEKIGFVGLTGSGKSTIVQLLLGFYSPSSGSIKINGVNIGDLDIKLLRESIAYVNQEPLLYSKSIRKNIKLGNKNCTDQDIEYAAKTAEAMEFIENLPEKMNTFVGHKGSQISGGEKQRIALARAFARKAKLIILDEATSALDVITESKIISNLQSQSVNESVIVIAQRLRTVKDLDTIHYVKNGEILESGTFNDLRQKKQHFYTLLSATEEYPNDEPNSSISEVVETNPCIEPLSLVKASYILEAKEVTNISLFPVYYRAFFAIIIVSSMVAGAVFPLFGYCFSLILSNLFTINNAKEQNLNLMWYIIADSIVFFISQVIMNYYLAKLFGNYTEKLRNDSFSSIVYYDSAFFDSRSNSPQILSGVLRDESQKVSSLGGPVLSIPLLLIFSELAGFITSLTQNYILSPIKFGLLLIYIYLMNKYAKFINGTASKVNSDELNNIASNSLSCFKTMNALNLQNFFYKKYAKELKRLTSDNVKISFKSAFLSSLRFGADFITNGAFFYIAAYFVKIGVIPLSCVVKVQVILNCSGWVLNIVASLLPDIHGALSASKIVSKLLSYRPKIDVKSTKGIVTPISGRIEFSNVSFTYPSNTNPSLNSCSFLIEPGQSIGIAGSTGSGKSTITMLLLRFYTPSSGFIYIDGQEIENYNIAYIRSRIAWVGQEPVVFQGSILQNLRLGNEEITIEQALDALEKAQASDIVESYGLESDVGVRGSFLSGGQKQRIAIARALARKSSVLILDEATSALDNITEERLKCVLREQMITMITIAHKLDTIKNSDKIIILEKGYVVQEGTDKELMKRKGLYRTFTKNYR